MMRELVEIGVRIDRNEEFGYLIRIVIYRGQNRSQRNRRFVNFWKAI